MSGGRRHHVLLEVAGPTLPQIAVEAFRLGSFGASSEVSARALLYPLLEYAGQRHDG